MPFDLRWTVRAVADYATLKQAAESARAGRDSTGKSKSSRAEGLFRQFAKTIELLRNDPKHPGLNCHEFSSLTSPYEGQGKVWEAYVQNNTPGAYRLFWCYGPGRGLITIIAITPHP